MFRRLIATSSTWVTIPLRLALAAVFIAHGSQKVFGSFGGPGLREFVSGRPAPFPFMEKGLWLWLGAAAFSELIGGGLLLLGLLTRVAAFFLACTMFVALFAYHAPAFFAPKGFEYPMVLLAACLALLISGGGVASADLAMTGSGRRRR